jgi:hypothetical protein
MRAESDVIAIVRSGAIERTGALLHRTLGELAESSALG